MIDTVTDILRKYGDNEITADEANAELRKIPNCHVYIDPHKNVISEEEMNVTNGYGLLYDGVGNPEKVEIVDGKLTTCEVFTEGAVVKVGDVEYSVDTDGVTLIGALVG